MEGRNTGGSDGDDPDVDSAAIRSASVSSLPGLPAQPHTSEQLHGPALPPALELRPLLPAHEPDLRHLRQVLIRYAAGRVGDPHAAEDLVQETLLVAATGARPAGPPEPYLVGVLKNKVADHYRRQGQVTPRDPEDFTGLMGADRGEQPHEAVERTERAALARRLLARLGERDRDLLLLRMSGASAIETGEALGMSGGAVRVAQHRALERLRKLIAAEGDRV